MKCSVWTTFEEDAPPSEENHWTRVYGYKKQCPEEACVWLCDQNGKEVPGCWTCKEHADEYILEYRAVFQEEWSAKPLDPV